MRAPTLIQPVRESCCKLAVMEALKKAGEQQQQQKMDSFAELWEACLQGDASKLRAILVSLGEGNAQSVVNITLDGGNTLLYKASEDGEVELVKALIEFGADGRLHPLTRHSPLYIAASRGKKDVVDILLEQFPDLAKQMTVERWLALHAAALNGHHSIVERLLNHQYPSSMKTPFRDSSGRWEFTMPFDVNAKDVADQSALYAACRQGDQRTVEVLLKCKVWAHRVVSDLSDTSVLEASPVRGGAGSGKLRSIMTRLTMESSDEEIPSDFQQLCPLRLNDLNRSDSGREETALHAAVRGKHHQICSTLLRAGADPNIVSKGDEERSPIEDACRLRDNQMMELLLRHGATDSDSGALRAAAIVNDDRAVAKLLSLKAHKDNENKINPRFIQVNKKALEALSDSAYTAALLIPNTPVMINWHRLGCHFSRINEQWLIDAGVILNMKLKLSPQSRVPALGAITRLDVSANELIELPECVFSVMPSLKVLTASQNKIAALPASFTTTHCNIEEIHLQDNRIEEIPTVFFRLLQLQLMDISNNKIQQVPSDMWHAPRLKDLNLSMNLLRDLPGASGYQQEPVMTFEEQGLQSKNAKKKDPCEPQMLKHHTRWRESLQLVESHPEESITNRALQSLNLSHNAFEWVPAVLACNAPQLARLSLAYNKLIYVGPLNCYPAQIRHLDLSCNQIGEWLIAPGSPHVEPCSVANKENSAAPGNKHRCIHRAHNRLESLRTLLLGNNRLTQVVIASVEKVDERLLFPNLSMLDMANNSVSSIPAQIAELQGTLSVLNLSGNSGIVHLPPELGLLNKLWNLNLRGCSLQEPLRTMIESRKYKTMDIVGYLKSILEDARPYARMKLMVVGTHGIGKTSLLEALRGEGSGKTKAPEHWAKRMGNKNMNLKNVKGVSLSTVGVDVGDWVFEKKPGRGPVLFRTWDFGGQREYYSTHQYFLSKRSLYLVVWSMLEGERGVRSLHQWLVNIQARAPNSPVIIVATHHDLVQEKYPSTYSEDLQQMVRDRFLQTVDADKRGLPRILDSIEVSCKTKHNIRRLAELIYDTAYDLRCTGSKERLLEQRIPASYLALEDIVHHLAVERRTKGKDPVLKSEEYVKIVGEEMKKRFNMAFRDKSELNQATMFLHESGVLLHYEDATLRDLYFIDPQWLCDMLAHVVTIREVNPFARQGIMRVEDLKIVFKASTCAPADPESYILSLLNKFEVALTWDGRNLLIPSLLPTEDQMRAGADIKVPARSRTWVPRGPKNNSSNDLSRAGSVTSVQSEPSQGTPLRRTPQPDAIQDIDREIRRVIVLSYLPSGFWPRLMTRILADDLIMEALRSYYVTPPDCPPLPPEVRRSAEWICWQSGLELHYAGVTILRISEVLSHLPTYPDYFDSKILVKCEQHWETIDVNTYTILDVKLPRYSIKLEVPLAVEVTEKQKLEESKLHETHILRPSDEAVTQLLSLAVERIDTLLEDWYPTLGTRFVHTSEGRFLVTRLVPCSQCVRQAHEVATWRPSTRHLQPPVNNPPHNYQSESGDSGVFGNGSSDSPRRHSAPVPFVEDGEPSAGEEDESRRCGGVDNGPSDRPTLHCFTVEECILAAHEHQAMISCEEHGTIMLADIAPDAVFIDMSGRYLINPDDIKRGKMLGRGAFGFVFRASMRTKLGYTDVALKMLQPVDPGFGARHSDSMAYKAASSKWVRDPLQYAAKAYYTARQELLVLQALTHPCIVPLIGVCPRPLALVLALAPRGALDAILREYRRCGVRVEAFALRTTALQVARALEYLHQQRIIYRDLKSENVLVWTFPTPTQLEGPVRVKLADYGISRAALPTGTKGFGGTEGFMAPEIVRHNGEEEYTERVDCFSFGMFLYELVALRPPFEGSDCVKDHILDGGRPMLSHREALSTPGYQLDLMTRSWAQLPADRPSASQLVSIVTAPEFGHFLDAVSLKHDTVSACAVDKSLWMARVDGKAQLLTSDGGTWAQLKVIPIEVDCQISSLCYDGLSNVWLGDNRSRIHVVEAHTYQRTRVLEVACDSAVAQISLHQISRKAERSKKGNEHVNVMLSAVVTEKRQVWWTCIRSCEIRSPYKKPACIGMKMAASDDVDDNDEESQGDECRLESSTYTGGQTNFTFDEIEKLGPVLNTKFVETSDPDVIDLWCGCEGGSVAVVRFRDLRPMQRWSLSHTVTGSDVAAIETAPGLPDVVWSYTRPGSLIHQWDCRTRQKSHKLDCSKLIPCSESIVSIGLEEDIRPSHCQVTAIAVQSHSSSPGDPLLYAGTAWGVVVVARARGLRPITAFRPFEQEVRVICPFTNGTMLATLGTGYRSLIQRYMCAEERHSMIDVNYVLLWNGVKWEDTTED
ncbi:leucine-rich repeat serine/threonine-protein kinase 1-like isoform X3 [Varroa destructor]|uniref:non-specific serine/threonine protein kinase n=1 Tax=Varroa destructor TaxID=109461 RepID=A0A7M7JTE0_VARDE|nr:leucine-rich repeat serine/threonine-protein kinase 1-like isoform X3 [Varroa destructor]